MKKRISLVLAIILILAVILGAASCAKTDALTPEQNDDGIEESTEAAWEDNGKITVPEYKDYGRKTVNFDEIEYIHPDVDAIIKNFSDAAKMISENEAEYSVQLDAVIALEAHYYDFTTMYSYASVMNSIDRADENWSAEFNYLNSARPSFTRETEKLFVAAALSEHCDRFEADYFGVDSLEPYKCGEVYTDELVSLLAKESELENEYSALTTKSTEILYDGILDTAAAHLERIKEEFKNSKKRYNEEYSKCMELYNKKLSQETARIFTELVAVRKEIATAYGYDSYAELAYSSYGRDYSQNDMKNYIKNVSKYIFPVYAWLENAVFTPYFKSNAQTDIEYPSAVINSLYSLYTEECDSLGTAFSYMLQHKLYNYEKATPDRFSGSFTTYLDNFNAPFVFVSATGDRCDYMTLAHEFGHFYDAYVNYGNTTSLDLEEVSSTALEFLTVLALDGSIDDECSKYLYYSAVCDALKAIVYQSTYALFEHYVYELGEDEISREALESCAKAASREMGFDIQFSLSAFMVPHTLLYPFYVQSYATSSAISFEILFAEIENEGAGLSLYLDLVKRGDSGKTLKEELDEVGISSPFKANTLKELADKIHFNILGSHYFEKFKNENNAA